MSSISPMGNQDKFYDIGTSAKQRVSMKNSLKEVCFGGS